MHAAGKMLYEIQKFYVYFLVDNCFFYSFFELKKFRNSKVIFFVDTCFLFRRMRIYDVFVHCVLCDFGISSVMLLYLPYHVLAQRAPQNGHGFEMDVLVGKNMAINADFCKGDEL